MAADAGNELPALPCLRLICARYQTSICALDVTEIAPGEVSFAWVAVYPSGDVQGSTREFRKQGQASWSEIASDVAELSEGLVVALWAERCIEVIRSCSVQNEGICPTFANLHDINHWSGPARGAIRMNTADLYSAYFPNETNRPNTGQQRAASIARIADEIVFLHGAQITGLGSNGQQMNAVDRAGNTKVLAYRIRAEILEHGFESTHGLVYRLKAPVNAIKRALYYGMKAGIVPHERIVNSNLANAIDDALQSCATSDTSDRRLLIRSVSHRLQTTQYAQTSFEVIALHLAHRADNSAVHQKSLSL